MIYDTLVTFAERWDIRMNAERINMDLNDLLRKERKRQGFSVKDLSRGVMPEKILERMESGMCSWKNIEGDFLLQRLGIPGEYYECIATDEKMTQWMKQEEITRLILVETAEAKRQLIEYSEKYYEKNTITQLFIKKAECIILFIKWMESPTQQLAERILGKAEESIKITIPYEWNCNEVNLPLAPDELEAILLLSIAKRINGKREEAWKLICYVWSYPGIHNWDESMLELIHPAAAIAALWNSSLWEKQNEIEIWQMSETALECLRQNGSARYGLFLLRMMYNYPKMHASNQEKEEIIEFLNFFEQLNNKYDQSQYRLWQNIDMTNAYPMSLFLKRIRMANRKNIRQAAEHNLDFINKTHLGRIENGKYIPTSAVIKNLLNGYGKSAETIMPLVDTNQKRGLYLRRKIVLLHKNFKYEESRSLIAEFCAIADTKMPRTKQQILFWKANMMKYEKETISKVFQTYSDAFYCTVPRDIDLKEWIFQREEGMIAKNIGTSLYEMGEVNKAVQWYESLYTSMQKNRKQNILMHKCEHIMQGGYAELLGYLKLHWKAIEIDEELIREMSKATNIDVMQYSLYDWVWNIKILALSGDKKAENMEQEGKKYFQMAYSLAKFNYDKIFLKWLEGKKTEYLVPCWMGEIR